jgi:putative transcriptional regulator
MKFLLQDVRKARQLSQNQFAKLCDMSVTNIQKYEQQKMKSIPFNTLEMFCQILKCSPGDLFE